MPRRPTQPDRPDPLTQAAIAALGDGRFEQAETLATQALARAPRAPHALAARAAARVRLRDYPGAEVDITAALRLHPAPPPPWTVTLAHVHRGRGRLDDALATLHDAHRRFPASQTLAANLAEVLATLRRHPEALDLLAPLVAKGADRPALLAQFGRICRHLDRPADALEPLRRAADRPDHPAAARQQVLFELGAVLDALGSYDEAFDAFARANALESRLYDIDGQAAAIDRVVAEWTRDALGHARRALAPAGDGGEGVVLIVGMRRSGTTLAERILAAHPRVAAGGELPHLREAAELVDPDPARRLGLVTELDRCTPDVISAAGGHYLAAARSLRSEASTVTDKMPANFKLLGLAQFALPACRVVWCRRDPLDTCLSCFMQPFNDNSYCADLRTLARYHHDTERLMRHWQRVLELPILELSYELLVAEPETTTRELLDFCALPFDEACLRFDRAGDVARTASTDQVARPLYTSAIGRAANYRRHLAPLTEELDRLAGLPAPPPAPPE